MNRLDRFAFGMVLVILILILVLFAALVIKLVLTIVLRVQDTVAGVRSARPHLPEKIVGVRIGTI